MKNIGVLIFNTKIMVIIIVQILFLNVLQGEGAFQVVQCVVWGLLFCGHSKPNYPVFTAFIENGYCEIRLLKFW